MSLETKIQYLPSVGPKFAAKLNRLGIETIQDLLFYFPRKYEDYTNITNIRDIGISKFQYPKSKQFPNSNSELKSIYPQDSNRDVFTIKGSILGIANKKTSRRGFVVTEGVITDNTGSIKVIWFNQPYLAKMLKPGSELILNGKVSHDQFSNSLVMESPNRANRPKIVPVYPETAGISSYFIARLFQKVKGEISDLKEYLPLIFLSCAKKSVIPAEAGIQRIQTTQLPGSPGTTLRNTVGPEDDNKNDNETIEQCSNLSLMPLQEAIIALHEPKNNVELEIAQHRLAFDELFLISLRANVAKVESSKLKAQSIKIDLEKVKEFIGQLPFELTGDQKKALWQIIQDIEKPVPMSRLLNGDVGSGKTIIAVIASYVTVKAGKRVLLMCPTSILASQHYETFCQIFRDYPDIIVGLKTADREITNNKFQISNKNPNSKGKNRKLNSELLILNSDIIIGTQALIQKGVEFENVGLVITDEQHRFGVKQREALQSEVGGRRPEERSAKPQTSSFEPQTVQKLRPHFLSMTATPIPRTLHLALFGDLDVSVIREKPANRKEIKTRFVASCNRQKAYEFIRAQIKGGRQVFVICPLIEEAESEKQKAQSLFDEERKSVKEEFEKLKTIFPEFEIAMLHGKMKAREKDEVMAKFAIGDSKILVSTSVVEVGVDIPNASIMMIEDAERFGLAQIHQFRGRVGRGEHQSFCLLFSNSRSEKALTRLQSLEKISDGFKLAEVDLEMRGPGAIFGTEQSGLLDLKMASLSDQELINKAAQAAKEIALNINEYPRLLEKLAQFESSKHLE